jgi:hypothetical protein
MPKPSLRSPADASAWSLDMAEALGRRTARSWSSGAGPGGRRTGAAIGSRPAWATGRPRSRAAAPPPSLAAGRRDWRPGADRPAALPFDFIHLASAVVLTPSLKGQQLGVPRELLKRCQ